MEPANFDGTNATMGPPNGMTDDQCGTIFAQMTTLNLIGGPMPCTITCWKPSRAELDEIERTGRVWLTVLGHGMPPVILGAEKPS